MAAENISFWKNLAATGTLFIWKFILSDIHTIASKIVKSEKEKENPCL